MQHIIKYNGEDHSIKFKKTSDKDILDIEVKNLKTKAKFLVKNAAKYRYGHYQHMRGGGYVLNIMGYGASQGDLCVTRSKYISDGALKHIESTLNSQEKLDELYKWHGAYIHDL